jgi:hypothetical protein
VILIGSSKEVIYPQVAMVLFLEKPKQKRRTNYAGNHIRRTGQID